MKRKIEKSNWFTEYSTSCCNKVVDKWYKLGKDTCEHCGTNIDYRYELVEKAVREVITYKKCWFLFIPYWKVLNKRLEYKGEKDKKVTNELLEKFANQAHISWAGWTSYMFSKGVKNEDGSITIPKWGVDRWTRQINTDYKDLSEQEKESDRKEAREYLSLLNL